MSIYIYTHATEHKACNTYVYMYVCIYIHAHEQIHALMKKRNVTIDNQEYTNTHKYTYTHICGWMHLRGTRNISIDHKG